MTWAYLASRCQLRRDLRAAVHVDVYVESPDTSTVAASRNDHSL